MFVMSLKFTYKMKKCIILRIIASILTMLLFTNMTNAPTTNYLFSIDDDNKVNAELLYDNVWGTVYNAHVSQCDSTPFHTADGSFIIAHKASKLRWIAISQEMLNDNYRSKLVTSKSPLFKGKIKFGDTVYIESSNNSKLNGLWVVHDAKRHNYRRSIDFLQTEGDKSLYKDIPQWSGKFNNLKIFKIKRYD